MDKLVEIIFKKLEFLPTSIGYIVGGIAAIGALFYVGHKVWHSMTKGEPIDPYPLLRPVVVSILIFAFPTFVITPIHYILSPTRTATAQMIYERKGENKVRLEQIKKDVEARRAAAAEVEAQRMREVGGDEALSAWGVGQLFNKAGAWIRRKIVQGLLWVAEVMRMLMAIFFKLLRIVFLVILGCVGPIALAMSLFPSYENSFGGWLSKYIGIYMWLPLCNLLEIIANEVDLQMMIAMHGGTLSSEAGISWLLILMAVAIIFVYLQIPDMAGWIIQGGSISLQAMTGAMAAVGGAIGGGAGALAGFGARRSGLSTWWKKERGAKQN